MSSYRPIALTCTIGKLLERLIVNRLSWWLETKSLLCPWQAGFRKRRFTTDQCLRLSQFVSDGFQSTNKERTVLMLFDYSKAYDTVWITGLLQKLLDIGVPLRFVQWTMAWLTNRIARVQLNGVTGMPYLQGRTTAMFSTFTATLCALHQRSSREFQRIRHG